MDQNITGENVPKDSNSKSSGVAKTTNGRGNPMGPGFAMKIPGKQPPKSTQTVKKGRPIKPTANKEGQSSNSTPPDLPNSGSSQPKVSKDGRRNIKEEKSLPDGNPNRNTNSRDKSPGNTHNSHNHSESTVSRMDNGDSNDKRQPPPMLNSEPDRNHLTDNLKQLLSIGGDRVSRIIYSRIQLLNISENPSSKHRPECLDTEFNATNGRWDPETWHRSLTSPTSQPPTTITGERIQRLSLSESRDRFTDDSSQGGIILGPQRRSFQDGCHVTNSAALKLSSSKLHLPSPTEPGRHAGRPRLVLRQRSEADYDSSTAPNRERQIESASALRSEEFDWDRRGDRESRFRDRDLSDLRPEPRNRRELPRDLHELRSEFGRDHRDGDFRDREREFRDRRFSNSREHGAGWYSQRERRDQRYPNAEPEPEWYTDGPTSQFDTIELGGFEEDTPAAAADFSSWGGAIPTDDLDFPGKTEKKKEGDEEDKDKEQKEEESQGKERTDESESNDSLEKSGDQPSEDGAAVASTEAENVADDVKFTEMDFNDLLEIPGFSAVVEQILKENPEQLANINEEKPATESQQSSSSSSRFSQWFQKDQNMQSGSASGVSTPHEELEHLVELAAERGLASPVDVESRQQQQPAKTQNDIMRLLVQGSKLGGFGSGNISPSLRQDPVDHQQELARKLLLQQMKSGTVMSAAELEAKAGARQSPSQSYGGVDMQNTDAFNKLVASIREKDKIRHHRQQLFAQQQAVLNQFQGKPQNLPQNLNIPGGRNPSPEELAAHTRNIFQQALIKKQLEKQKEAYGEKIRQIEQQRREEQLREAIRSADAKMKESKQVNKSLSFTPTSVMRKMQESREGKMSAMGDEMMGMPGDAEDLASATASFSAKLANKKLAASQQLDGMNHQGNDLLSRIYQSAANNQSKTGRNDGTTSGMRRNASYPEVLMDANKMNRSSAFHQPVHRSMASSSMDMSNLNISGDSETARLRSLLSMTNDPNSMKSQTAKPMSLKTPGGIAADIYNNNMLKVDTRGGKYDRSSPGGVKTLLETMEKPINDSVDVELKNQHEVALLTQFVLNQNGITEDQLSRLTPQQQLAVVNSVQKHYHLLQRQKQQLAMERKVQKDASMRMKQGDLPSMNNAKHDIQAAMANKNVAKLDQNDPRLMSLPKPTTSASMGIKFPPQQQQQATIPGIGLQGMIPTTNHQIHPLQLRSILPQPMQFIPPPMTRGHPMLSTAFLPPQAHIPGRLMPPHPPNVPLAGPYPAAAFMQMQLYQQQQQQQQALFAAAAIQQQRMQAFAAARQQSANKESRGGEFSNPLERWFGPDVLSHSHLPPPQQKTMTLTDIERANQINQKQE